MANIAHSSLTGTDLHEAKGAATAALGEVPVATGSGSAPFAKLTHTSLQTTGNPFGGQLLHIQDQQSAGTVGQAVTTGSGTVRLNTTLTNEISGASLSTNQIVLPAGTYYIDAAVPFGPTGFSAAKLYNVTDASNILLGTSVAGTGVAITLMSNIKGRFTLGSTKTVQLTYVVNQAGSLGSAHNLQTEVYTDIQIWKVA